MKTIVKSELAYHYGGSNRGNALAAGQALYAGDALISNNGLFYLIYQTDGNLVLYDWNDRPIWDSATWGKPAGRAALQTDGNFCIYNSANTPIWATMVYGGEVTCRNSKLLLDDNGNLRAVNNYQQQYWTTNTGRVIPGGAAPSAKTRSLGYSSSGGGADWASGVSACGAVTSIGGVCGAVASGAQAAVLDAGALAACGAVTAVAGACGAVASGLGVSGVDVAAAGACAAVFSAAGACGAVAGLGGACGAVANGVGMCGADAAGASVCVADVGVASACGAAASVVEVCAGVAAAVDACGADADFGVQAIGVCGAEVGLCGAVACIALPIGGNW